MRQNVYEVHPFIQQSQEQGKQINNNNDNTMRAGG